jgi:ABC-type transport system involved in cytochrome bd biosynthesis fused ATPase/permease subunit
MQPDPKKLWIDFKQEFLRNSFKIIKRDVRRYHASDAQILKIIKERHRHQREKYLVQQNPEKEKQERKKNREQQRMTAVRIFCFHCINVLTISLSVKF